MEVTYSTRKIKDVCENSSIARKTYGIKMAARIHQRIEELRAADSIDEILQYHVGRCHKLHGDRKNQFAMDLIHPYRLEFEKIGNVCIANVIEITDYH